MRIEYPGFGRITIEDRDYDHDVVIERGSVRPRDKEPSKGLKARFGHTPLSAREEIPWTLPRLIIGTGYSSSLPVLDEIRDEADRRGVGLVVLSTAEACALIRETEDADFNAILHVTC